MRSAKPDTPTFHRLMTIPVPPMLSPSSLADIMANHVGSVRSLCYLA